MNGDVVATQDQPVDDDAQNYSDLSDHSEGRKGVGKPVAFKKSKPIEFDGRNNTKNDVPIGSEELENDAKDSSNSALCDPATPTAVGESNDDDHDLDGEDGDELPMEDLDRVTPQRTISNISVVSIGTSSYYNTNLGDDGNSVCGASTDGSFAGYTRTAKAESIRARLRQQERKLSDLVQRQASADVTKGDQFKQQMDTVKSNLDKVEQEKYALEQKLEFLKIQQEQQKSSTSGNLAVNIHDVTDHDEFLRDKLNGIQRGFQEQASKIQSLETEIVTKNVEIDKYRYEIVAKLKRIVELEFDLEMHNIHYTDYANNQVRLVDDGTFTMSTADTTSTGTVKADYEDQSESPDNLTLSPLKVSKRSVTEVLVMGSEDEDSSAISDLEISLSGEKQKLTPKRAQKLIAKLLKDLDHLEATYKKEKLKAVRTKEQLKNENEELRTKIHVLEQEQKLNDSSKKNIGGSSAMNEVSGYMNIYQLRKRVETLEAKRFLYRKEMARLHEEMNEDQKMYAIKAEKNQIEISRLKLELEAANARCTALLEAQQQGDSYKAISNHFAAVEQRIKENYEMISKLEAASEIKDQQITTLKKEIQNLRLQQIANGRGGRQYTETDAEILKAEKDSHTHDGDIDTSENGASDDEPKTSVSASFIADLQKQLLLAHEQLVKKDQELVIERAKSACMAANLLDRIAELDKESERFRRRESASHVKPSPHSSGGEKERLTPEMAQRTSISGTGMERHTSIGDNSVRSTRSTDKFDSGNSVRSTRSSFKDETGDTAGPRKNRKSLSSRIPFRFNLPGGSGKKEGKDANAIDGQGSRSRAESMDD